MCFTSSPVSALIPSQTKPVAGSTSVRDIQSVIASARSRWPARAWKIAAGPLAGAGRDAPQVPTGHRTLGGRRSVGHVAILPCLMTYRSVCWRTNRPGEVSMTTVHMTCPLCEATCGLEVTLDANQQVTRVQGDEADVFSKGYICPKGASLGALHHDPDRLTAPLVKRDGEFVEVSWQEAFDEIDRRLPPLLEKHGRDAVAVYAGNPGVHNLALTLYGRVLYKALGTKNFYSATSADQLPKHFSSGYL